MSRFRRRGREDETPDDATDAVDEETSQDDPGAEDSRDASSAAGRRTEGPWDVSDVDNPADGRVNLGALWIPGRPGLELRVSGEGRKAWSMRYRTLEGQQRRVSLGTFPAVQLADVRAAGRREKRAQSDSRRCEFEQNDSRRKPAAVPAAHRCSARRRFRSRRCTGRRRRR